MAIVSKTIFIGSPGDLQSERQIIQDAIAEFNRVHSIKFQISFVALGWEYLGASRGRPQSNINEELLQKADIFVGILWKRWGSPTGKFSSGFEEEFNFAKDKKISDMWLYFKEVSKKLIDRPDSDLQKVLGFRAAIEQNREFTYDKFRNENDWKELFKAKLMNYAAEQLKKPIERTLNTKKSKKVKIKDPKKKSKIKKTTLNESLTGLAGVLDTPANNSRIYLAAVTRLYNSNLASQLLGAHELNLIYKYHQQYKLDFLEQLLVARTILLNKEDVYPGYYWLTEFNKSIESLLLFLAKAESTSQNKARIIELLLQLNVKVKISDIKNYLTESDESIVVNAVKLLGAQKGSENLVIFNNLINTKPGPIGNSAIYEKLKILIKSPDDAVKFFLSLPESNQKESIELVLPILHERVKDYTGDLFRVLSSSKGTVQKKIFSVLKEQLSHEELLKIMDSASVGLKAEVLKELIVRKIPIDESLITKIFEKETGFASLLLSDGVDREHLKKQLLWAFYKQKTKDELAKIVTNDFYDSGSVAYGVLAEIDPDSRKLVINDLENGMERIKKDYQKHLSTFSGDDQKKYTGLIPFVAGKFILSGVQGLSKKPEKSDMKAIRRIVNESQYYKAEILEIVFTYYQKFGTTNDVSQILELLSDISPKLKQSAVKILLKLGKNKTALIHTLLDKNDLAITKQILILSLSKQNLSIAQCIHLLNSEQEDIRIVAVHYLIKKLGRIKLEKTLRDYLLQDRYFYNVVSRLDSFLYGSPIIKRHITNEGKEVLT